MIDYWKVEVYKYKTDVLYNQELFIYKKFDNAKKHYDDLVDFFAKKGKLEKEFEIDLKKVITIINIDWKHLFYDVVIIKLIPEKFRDND